MRSRTPVILALVAAATASACGGGDDAGQQVRGTLDRFAKATSTKDFQTICDQVFAKQLVDKVNQAVPCELALKNSSLGDAKKPTLRVLKVEVDGDKATARVRTAADNQPASEDDVGLIKENGEWRIISLSSGSEASK